MELRLIHGTIAVFGDRAAISDLAILTELSYRPRNWSKDIPAPDPAAAPGAAPR